MPNEIENPVRAEAESPAESLFLEPPESAFGGLETATKNPIYSTSCGSRLCARRNPPFMAQIAESAPHFAPLIRDILEGLT
jgi:hypothetical protein